MIRHRLCAAIQAILQDATYEELTEAIQILDSIADQIETEMVPNAARLPVGVTEDIPF